MHFFNRFASWIVETPTTIVTAPGGRTDIFLRNDVTGSVIESVCFYGFRRH
jgi:hypothetical protein